MSELNLMITIVNRPDTRRFLELYEGEGLELMLATVGRGTAASEMFDYFGLEASDKTVLLSVVTGDTWKRVKSGMRSKLRIDIPGTGISFIVPVSSIGGKRQLEFLTSGQNFELGEESSLKETRYELLVIVTNLGYTEMVMDAAREAGAGGGTVIHAKGTGMEKAEQFLGVKLASEKEMVLIVVRQERKNPIMRAIMEHAGMKSKAKSIVFSLPVTDTAGLRLTEELEQES